MGLFSFLKEVNKNTSGVKPNDGIGAVEEEKRNATIQNYIGNLGLNIKDLGIDIDRNKVTIFGQAETQSDKEKLILAIGNIEGIEAVDDRITVVTSQPSRSNRNPTIDFKLNEKEIINQIIYKTKNKVLHWLKYNDSSCFDTEMNDQIGYILCLYNKPTGKVIAIGVTDDWGIITKEIMVDENDPCFNELKTVYEQVEKESVLEVC